MNDNILNYTVEEIQHILDFSLLKEPQSLTDIEKQYIKNNLGIKEVAAVTEQTIADWGFTKNKGTYIKPSTGIPISDLAPSIQTSLNNADNAIQLSQLSTVALSGSYNDLSNKPLIPEAVTEDTIYSWGFTKNTGNYSKPTSGIPISDLSEEILDSLNKASTSVQPVDLLSKQDLIADLESIREGASKGATALQQIPSYYVTDTQLTTVQNSIFEHINSESNTLKSDIAELDNQLNEEISKVENNFKQYQLNITETNKLSYSLISDVPTKLSQFNNDTNYVTAVDINEEVDDVKDAELNGEKVYFKGHAKCTYLSDGRTVEQAMSDLVFYEGFNAVTTVAQIPTTKRLVLVSLSTSEALSMEQTPKAGREIHVIINNSGSSALQIALPNTGSYICMTESAISLEAGEYAELNIISDGQLMYIRGI